MDEEPEDEDVLIGSEENTNIEPFCKELLNDESDLELVDGDERNEKTET